MEERKRTHRDPVDEKEEPDPKRVKPSSGTNSTDLAAILEQKKQLIAQRLQAKLGTSITPKDAPKKSDESPSATLAPNAAALARQRVEELYAKKFGVSVPNLGAANSATSPMTSMAPPSTTFGGIKRGLQAEVHPSLMLDESGKLNIRRDRTMPLITKPHFATTKANLRVAQQVETRLAAATVKKVEDKSTKDTTSADITKMPFYDANLGGGKYSGPNIHLAVTRPRKTGFKFIQKGTISAQANQIRQEARFAQLREKIAEGVKATGLDAELEMVGDAAVKHDPVPNVEWWDTQFLPSQSYEDLDHNQVRMDEEVVNDLIQHPVPIEPSFEAPYSSIVRTVMLSTREKKKMRRLRRLEEQKERQDKVRLGLLPPDPPKVKLSNLMRVLGNEAVADPTLIEQQVRDQVQKRLERHVQENEERKLTEEERAEKRRRKLQEDTSRMVHVAVFKIRNVDHPSHRFKIDKNAQQLNLTGVCVVHSTCNIVIVEGGPKGVDKYKKLMLRRINWDEKIQSEQQPAEDDTEEEPPTEKNECVLVWEGTVKEGNFRGFRFRLCPTEARIKDALGEGALQFWHLAKNFSDGLSSSI